MRANVSRANASVPLYRQVQEGIEALIGAARSKQKLRFTDAELAARFGVSRITVRRAVDELVDAGVLYRIQGLGTFVSSRKLSEKLTLNSFLESWKGEKARAEIRVAALDQVEADPERAARLGVATGTRLTYVQRHRFDKGRLVAIDHRYIRADLCGRLTRQDILTSSLVDYLRNREGASLSRGEMEIEARASSLAEARVFGMKPGKPILSRRVLFFSQDAERVLDGESVYRADSVVYRLSLSADDA